MEETASLKPLLPRHTWSSGDVGLLLTGQNAPYSRVQPAESDYIQALHLRTGLEHMPRRSYAKCDLSWESLLVSTFPFMDESA